MELSKHFSLVEFTRSQTATRYSIENFPGPRSIENLRLLCLNVLEPVRKIFKMPLVISSGYRSPELNRKIGGSVKSQHMYGLAADFYIPGLKCTDVFVAIRASQIDYDQLILENPAEDGWVHISYHTNPRRQDLVATFINGRPIYSKPKGEL